MSRPRTTTATLLLLICAACLVPAPGAALTFDYFGILDTGGSYAEFGTSGLPSRPPRSPAP